MSATPAMLVTGPFIYRTSVAVVVMCIAAPVFMLAAPKLFGDGPWSSSAGPDVAIERRATLAMVVVATVATNFVVIFWLIVKLVVVLVVVPEVVLASLVLMLATVMLLGRGPALLPVGVACSTIICHVRCIDFAALAVMFATPLLFVLTPYGLPIFQSYVTIVMHCQVLRCVRQGVRLGVGFVILHYIAADPLVVVAPLALLDPPFIAPVMARTAIKAREVPRSGPLVEGAGY
jgi:hypothetical protein